MKDDFILKVMQEFEKGDAVVLHIKQDDCELTLKKEGAFPKKENEVIYSAPPVYPVNGFPPYSGALNAGASFTQSPVETAIASNGSAASGKTEAVTSVESPALNSSPADKNIVEIKSPLVGTFYRAPSPDSPAYVEKGSSVKKGQPLCVLEAMKMMNTLECEYDGVIEDILVSNGDLVEFDQALFKIKIK